MVQKSIRKLSENEISFLYELDLYENVLKYVHLISLNQHGINTDGRGVRAMKIFTRQTLTAISLRKLIPTPSPTKAIDEDLWDISSIASLTRNIVEGFLSLSYFGLEKISESEAELRFFIFQLHRNTELFHIGKNEMDEVELKQFENGLPIEKERIKNHEYLNKLPSHQKKRALQGLEIYKTKADFEKDLSICKDLVKQYRHLSNLTHPLPLSIETINNNHGRGIGSDSEVNYSVVCIMLARRYLAATVVEVVDFFSLELGNKFKKELDLIRPLQNAGFAT